MNRVGASIALGLCMSVSGLAQFELASVVGTVRDPTGLPMPHVAVEIRSVATNIKRATATSATGDYDFVALQPGQYALTANQPGFKGTTRTFEIAVGKRLQLDVLLEVGAARERVTMR